MLQMSEAFDPYFSDLYFVSSLDNPHPTRLDRLPRQGSQVGLVTAHIHHALTGYKAIKSDLAELHDRKARDRVMQQHGKQFGGQLLELWGVWERLQRQPAKKTGTKEP